MVDTVAGRPDASVLRSRDVVSLLTTIVVELSVVDMSVTVDG